MTGKKSRTARAVVVASIPVLAIAGFATLLIENVAAVNFLLATPGDLSWWPGGWTGPGLPPEAPTAPLTFWDAVGNARFALIVYVSLCLVVAAWWWWTGRRRGVVNRWVAPLLALALMATFVLAGSPLWRFGGVGVIGVWLATAATVATLAAPTWRPWGRALARAVAAFVLVAVLVGVGDGSPWSPGFSYLYLNGFLHWFGVAAGEAASGSGPSFLDVATHVAVVLALGAAVVLPNRTRAWVVPGVLSLGILASLGWEAHVGIFRQSYGWSGLGALALGLPVSLHLLLWGFAARAPRTPAFARANPVDAPAESPRP